jgi:basic amino acid/polyamine antiporter, APA family
VLGIASCLLLLWQQETRTWGFAAVLLLGGVALHGLTRLADRRSEAAESARRG